MKNKENNLLKILGIPDDNNGQMKLFNGIKNLPLDNCFAIQLHFIDDKSRKQIAGELNWSLGKVNQKITRGITLLKKELNPAHFEAMNKLIAAAGNV